MMIDDEGEVELDGAMDGCRVWVGSTWTERRAHGDRAGASEPLRGKCELPADNSAFRVVVVVVISLLYYPDLVIIQVQLR